MKNISIIISIELFVICGLLIGIVPKTLASVAYNYVTIVYPSADPLTMTTPEGINDSAYRAWNNPGN